MRVPKRIKELIYTCAECNYAENLCEKEIHKWLKKNNLTEETAQDVCKNMDDCFIDSCILGYDAQGFIERLEEL